MPPFLADVSPAWLAFAVSAVAALGVSVRKAWPWVSRAKDIRDDMFGEPARPGVEARPGWGESIAQVAASMAELGASVRDWQSTSAARWTRIEREMQEMRAKVTSADYHSRPNGGRSAHDAIMQAIDATHKDMSRRMDEHVKDSVKAHDEFAEAIRFAIEGTGTVVADLAEALPIVARSQPHDDDAA